MEIDLQQIAGFVEDCLSVAHKLATTVKRTNELDIQMSMIRPTAGMDSMERSRIPSETGSDAATDMWRH